MSVVKAINVQEATIRTATVEVKTLTISGRQVTLSVFRQLPVATIFRFGPVRLAGQAWGRVHYFPAPCDKRHRGHLHVVWQCEGELRRACVDDVEWREGEFAHYAGSVHEDQRYYREQRDRLRNLAFAAEWLVAPAAAVVTEKSGVYGTYRVTLPSGAWWEMSPRWNENAGHTNAFDVVGDLLRMSRDGKLADVSKQLVGLRHLLHHSAYVSWDTLELSDGDVEDSKALRRWSAECEAKAVEDEQRLTDARKKYRDLYAELQSLPQLFIAV